MPTYSVQRKPPKAVTNASLAGAAEVDITPPHGITMAGYSKEGRRSDGVYGHLFARALYLQDEQGRCVSFCTIDLLSCSRYLLEKVASITAPACGVSIDRLILTGSHTHTAPGNYFGDSLYDIFAQLGSGFDVRLADWLSQKIASAIISAAKSAVPATVGVAIAPLWGACRNRSYEPFWRNPEAPNWHQPGFPGHGMPSGLEPREDAVDPRVTVIAAVRTSDQSLLAAHGFFSCHATSLSNPPEYYSSDLFGVASRVAQEKLFTPGKALPMIGVANAAAGDISPMRDDVPQGPSLMKFVGERLGAAVAKGALQAAANAKKISLEVRFIDPPNSETMVNNDPATKLSNTWIMGAPTLAGAEDARNYLLYPAFVQEGMVDTNGKFFPPQDPQHPKIPAFGKLQIPVLHELLNAKAMPVLPLHTIKVGDQLFVTFPGEPTITTSYRIEQRLQQELPGFAVTVLGYSAGYSGYFTTSEEYDAQHYEGSSMIFGRNASRHMEARFVQTLKGPVPPVDYKKKISFTTRARLIKFAPGSAGGSGDAKDVQVARKALRVDMAWRTPRKLRIDFSEGAYLWLEELINGVWTVVMQSGRPFDDQHQEILIYRKDGLQGILVKEALWRASFTLPRAPQPGAPLRVVVATRGGMNGFTRMIP